MFVLLIGGLTILVALAAGPRAASARTGAGTTGSACNCFCQCSAKYCDCKTYPDGTSSCDTRCWTCINCVNGVAGGGTVDLGDHQATVALFATAEKENNNKIEGATGLVRWVDPNGGGGPVVLESFGLSDYRVIGPNMRRLTGKVFANGNGPYPFQMDVTAAPPGGQDAISVVVGDETGLSTAFGFGYAASGNLVSGDLLGTWTGPTETPLP